MAPNTVSLVIPVYNMGNFIPELWRSLQHSGLLPALWEVIIVDDGSTDGKTAEAIHNLKDSHLAFADKVKPVILSENKGRFLARLAGTQTASGEKVLFLDPRNTLKDGFAQRFIHSSRDHDAVMGVADVDLSGSNVLCLYWERSHKWMFRKHVAATREPVWLTPENYDKHWKGTTVFMCDRAIFLASCEPYTRNPPLNDDTVTMREVVRRTPILIDPRLRINWVPQETWISYLGYLWKKGPSFVEYHVCMHQGTFFWVVVAGLSALASWLWILLMAPSTALAVLVTTLAIIAASAGVFAQSVKEWLYILPLHVAVVTTFSAAILRGLAFHCVQLLRGKERVKRPS